MCDLHKVVQSLRLGGSLAHEVEAGRLLRRLAVQGLELKHLNSKLFAKIT